MQRSIFAQKEDKKRQKQKKNKQTEQKICNGLKDILVTKTMKYELWQI